MRAIDGDRLKRKAQKVATEAWKMKIKANVEVILNEFIDWINDAPTIEPERKKGHWIRHPEQRNIFNGKTIECSECHEKYTVQYVEDEWFCRHCGADMREPEDIPMEYFESGGR